MTCAGAAYRRIIGVHHLTPEENRSRHHAFVEVLDEQGQRVRNLNLKIGWTWEERSEPDLTAPLEKTMMSRPAMCRLGRG